MSEDPAAFFHEEQLQLGTEPEPTETRLRAGVGGTSSSKRPFPYPYFPYRLLAETDIRGIEVQHAAARKKELTEEQIAGKLQALQTTIEQAASDFVLAHCRLAGLESRMESIEKLTNKQIAGEFPALQTAANQVAAELVLVNGWLGSLEKRMESIEELTKKQSAGEHQALEHEQKILGPMEFAD